MCSLLCAVKIEFHQCYMKINHHFTTNPYFSLYLPIGQHQHGKCLQTERLESNLCASNNYEMLSKCNVMLKQN